MIKQVYVDKERTKKISAEKALRENKDVRYYCLDHDCDAHMFLCGKDGLSSAHFRATHKEYSHSDNCNSNEINQFNPTEHDENSFHFNNAIEAMFVPSNSSVRSNNSSSYCTGEPQQPLRTIQQIYRMCKSKKCTEPYNGFIIGKMLFDERSEFMYPNGVFRLRIIESKVKDGYFYSRDKKEIQVTPLGSKKYEFILKFSDSKLFDEIQNKIYNNRNHKIIVSGNWNSAERYNCFSTSIQSSKQVAIIKNIGKN